MNVYELITPSDAITFKAEDDKIAFAVAIFLGEGKAGCRTVAEDGKEVSVPSMLVFVKDATEIMDEFVGMPFGEFVKPKEMRTKIAESMLSFAYTKLSNRDAYDKELVSFKTEEEMLNFKKTHEDRNRSSMTKWVQGAWKFGQNMLERIKKEETEGK